MVEYNGYKARKITIQYTIDVSDCYNAADLPVYLKRGERTPQIVSVDGVPYDGSGFKTDSSVNVTDIDLVIRKINDLGPTKPWVDFFMPDGHDGYRVSLKYWFLDCEDSIRKVASRYGYDVNFGSASTRFTLSPKVF
ncbi:MAG: hypothetical protein E7Z63_00930 [Thermoplasmata archaeon]|nr:hypothetical protein [Thermoplasmata archaeon]